MSDPFGVGAHRIWDVLSTDDYLSKDPINPGNTGSRTVMWIFPVRLTLPTELPDRPRVSD